MSAKLPPMWEEFIARLWRRAPKWVRRWGMLISESRFTVTTAAVIIDGRGRVLLLEHRFRPGSGWGIPGGFIRRQEQPEEAIRRELREEIGLEIECAEIAFVRTLKYYQQVEIIYRCRPCGEPQPRGFEVNRAEWFELSALPEGISSDQRKLIERAVS